jgi:hypothetical protein
MVYRARSAGSDSSFALDSVLPDGSSHPLLEFDASKTRPNLGSLRLCQPRLSIGASRVQCAGWYQMSS